MTQMGHEEPRSTSQPSNPPTLQRSNAPTLQRSNPLTLQHFRSSSVSSVSSAVVPISSPFKTPRDNRDTRLIFPRGKTQPPECSAWSRLSRRDQSLPHGLHYRPGDKPALDRSLAELSFARGPRTSVDHHG